MSRLKITKENSPIFSERIRLIESVGSMCYPHALIMYIYEYIVALFILQ